eukprot:8582899-Karenia_brevis.AAC.1
MLLLSRLAVHAGIDNQAVVTLGKRLIARLQHDINYKPLLPYNLQKDGDLWALVHEGLVQRGPHSVKLSKVKGHATWEDCTTEELKRHKMSNDCADGHAKKAHELCN